MLSTAAFQRAGLVPFVGEQVIHGGEAIFPDQAAKKFLRHILRIRWRKALAPDVGVERIPISAAELFQGCGGVGRKVISRSGNNTPPRRVEGRLTGRKTATGFWRGHASEKQLRCGLRKPISDFSAESGCGLSSITWKPEPDRP